METRTLPVRRHLPAPPLPYPPRSLRRGPAAGRRRHRELGWSHPDGVQLLPRAALPGTEPPGPRGTGLGAQGPQPEPQPGAGRGIPSVPYVPKGGRGPGPLREGPLTGARCGAAGGIRTAHLIVPRGDSGIRAPGPYRAQGGQRDSNSRDSIVSPREGGIRTPGTALCPGRTGGFESPAPHCVPGAAAGLEPPVSHRAPGGQQDSNPWHRIVSQGDRQVLRGPGDIG